MKENLYLTTSNNFDPILHSNQSGLVVSVSSATIGNGSAEIWTARPVVWINSEQSPFTSYSEVENAIEKSGVFVASSTLPHGTYAISLSERTFTVAGTISAIANSLEYSNSFNPISLISTSSPDKESV